jgi:hypothetical protein
VPPPAGQSPTNWRIALPRFPHSSWPLSGVLIWMAVCMLQLQAFEPLLDWLAEQNENATSPLYGLLDLGQLVVGGHSRGGKLATLVFAGEDLGCWCNSRAGGGEGSLQQSPASCCVHAVHCCTLCPGSVVLLVLHAAAVPTHRISQSPSLCPEPFPLQSTPRPFKKPASSLTVASPASHTRLLLAAAPCCTYCCAPSLVDNHIVQAALLQDPVDNTASPHTPPEPPSAAPCVAPPLQTTPSSRQHSLWTR